ncbi:MAG: hypothetical protein WAZ19_09555 [Anaerolineae bacterium]
MSTSRHEDEASRREHSTQIKVALITGIVTIIAAIITVVGGPLLTRYLDGSKTPVTADTAAPAIAADTAALDNAGSSLPAYKPMAQSSAVLTRADGSQTTVQADTLCWCVCSGARSLDLVDGSSILLDKVQRLDVVRAEPPGGKTVFTITLLDGSTLEGEAFTCGFIGETAAGRIDITSDLITRIEIMRN